MSDIQNVPAGAGLDDPGAFDASRLDLLALQLTPDGFNLNVSPSLLEQFGSDSDELRVNVADAVHMLGMRIVDGLSYNGGGQFNIEDKSHKPVSGDPIAVVVWSGVELSATTDVRVVPLTGAERIDMTTWNKMLAIMLLQSAYNLVRDPNILQGSESPSPSGSTADGFSDSRGSESSNGSGAADSSASAIPNLAF